MKTKQRIGVGLLIASGVFLGMILMLRGICFFLNLTLIYENLYMILAAAALVAFVPGILLVTLCCPWVLRGIAVLVVVALAAGAGAFLWVTHLLSVNLFLPAYDEIVYSREEGRRVVELTRAWTWVMESYGGVEYKKAYVVLGLFYDNDLIEHTGAPEP